MARFKELCLDADDSTALAGFWARVLNLSRVDSGDPDDLVIQLEPSSSRPPAEALWVNRVPEPRVGKTRAHLDLRLAEPDPEPLVAAGARIVRVPGADAWWVLADPEGNLFCAFPPRAGFQPGVYELVVDCRDARAQATWWAGVVGGEMEVADDAVSVVGGSGFPWEFWVFQPVPEPKTVKNRLHWDVDLVDDDPSALLAAGATLLREPDRDIHWWILADPEGNEFCAFAPDRD